MIGFDDIEYASLTDVGVRRSHNQDAHATLPASDAEQLPQRGHVFLVADGMGAHAVGELASKMAADSIPHIYSKHAQEGPIAALRKAFVEANADHPQPRPAEPRVRGHGHHRHRPRAAARRRLGRPRRRQPRLPRPQRPHRAAQLRPQPGLGAGPPAEARTPRSSHGIPTNVIVRSLGPEPLVQVDVEGPHPLQPGDIFVLCSDGLSGPVSDREIGAVASALPPAEACRFLIHLANLQGGPDNITCMIVRVAGRPRRGTDSSPEVDTSSSPSVELPPEPFTVRLHRWPWSIILLSLGIVLAAIAFYLNTYRVPGDLTTFVFAGLALAAGLVMMIMQSLRETQEAASPSAPRRCSSTSSGPAASTCPCSSTSTRPSRSCSGATARATSKAESSSAGNTSPSATQALADGDVMEAFRARCRAMLVLMESMRGKEEQFKPLWDQRRDAV